MILAAAMLAWVACASAQQGNAAQTDEPFVAQAAPDSSATPAPGVDSSSDLAPASESAAVDSSTVPVATTHGFSDGRLVVTRKSVRLTQKENVVRSGPGSGYSIVGVYAKDLTFTVIAKSDEWYNVRLSDISTGWVHASLCKELDDLSDLEFRPNPKLYTRTGSFVLGGYAGGYAFDRKSNSLVLGGRVGYYVFDRIQAEAGLSWTHVHRPAEIVESLFGLSLRPRIFTCSSIT